MVDPREIFAPFMPGLQRDTRRGMKGLINVPLIVKAKAAGIAGYRR